MPDPVITRVELEDLGSGCHTRVLGCLSSLERRFPPLETERSTTMTEYLQVWRAKVADADVERLLAVRPAAIAEAQRLCPALLRADLVRLGEGVWLDVLTWSSADGEERLMARAEEFDALHAMHAADADDIDALARRAADGERDALAALVSRLQHPMYRLALGFVGHPDDAEDACQEILIRIVTHLDSFEGRSKFTTWAYTVGTRSLLRTRKRFVETSVEGPEQFAAFLDAGLADADPTMDEVEYRLLCEEVRISCTYGMLLCVSRPQRAAYLLADVLGLTDVEGAEILGCSREAFRQRVSRARRTLRYVIDNRCGLVDPANPCRCGRQIAAGEAAGILRRDHLPLAEHAREEPRVWLEPVAKELDDVEAIGELYRFDRFAAPATLWEELRQRFPALLG